MRNNLKASQKRPEKCLQMMLYLGKHCKKRTHIAGLRLAKKSAGMTWVAGFEG
jgi:hypothetical protein